MWPDEQIDYYGSVLQYNKLRESLKSTQQFTQDGSPNDVIMCLDVTIMVVGIIHCTTTTDLGSSASSSAPVSECPSLYVLNK